MDPQVHGRLRPSLGVDQEMMASKTHTILALDHWNGWAAQYWRAHTVREQAIWFRRFYLYLYHNQHICGFGVQKCVQKRSNIHLTIGGKAGRANIRENNNGIQQFLKTSDFSANNLMETHVISASGYNQYIIVFAWYKPHQRFLHLILLSTYVGLSSLHLSSTRVVISAAASTTLALEDKVSAGTRKPGSLASALVTWTALQISI